MFSHSFLSRCILYGSLLLICLPSLAKTEYIMGRFVFTPETLKRVENIKKRSRKYVTQNQAITILSRIFTHARKN